MGCASTPFRFEDSEDRSMALSRLPGFRLGIYVSNDVEVIDLCIPCGVFSVARARGAWPPSTCVAWISNTATDPGLEVTGWGSAEFCW